MTTIDHAALSRLGLELADDQYDTIEGHVTGAAIARFTATAHVHAVLALAEAQHVANRLAYAALLPESSPTRKRILDDVGARLDPS